MNWNVTNRREFVKNSSRCYVCLVTYHTARNCPKKNGGWKCKFCFENTHHWTLCANQENQGESKNNLNGITTSSQSTTRENSVKEEVSLGHKYAINYPNRSYGGDNKFNNIDEPKRKTLPQWL